MRYRGACHLPTLVCSPSASPHCCWCCCCCSVVSDPVRPHSWQPTRLRPWDSPGKNTGVGCHFLLQCMKVKSESEVAQSCPTLSDPRDRSPPGSSIHGIFQARVLEWGAIAFSTVLLRQNFFLTVAVPDTGFEAQENGHTHSYGSHMAFLRLGLTISKEIHYLVGLEYWSLPFCLPSFPLLYQGWGKIVGQRTYI